MAAFEALSTVMNCTFSLFLLVALWSALDMIRIRNNYVASTRTAGEWRQHGEERVVSGKKSALKDTIIRRSNIDLVETALQTYGIPIDPELPVHLQRRLIRDVLKMEKYGYDYFSRQARKKRDTSEYVGTFSSCPNKAEYVIMHSGRGYSRNYTLVTEPGYLHQFYKVSCNFPLLAMNNTASCPKCCLGADKRNYNTECKTMRAYHPAKAYGNATGTYRWTFILIDSMCLCDVERRNRRNRH